MTATSHVIRSCLDVQIQSFIRLDPSEGKGEAFLTPPLKNQPLGFGRGKKASVCLPKKNGLRFVMQFRWKSGVPQVMLKFCRVGARRYGVLLYFGPHGSVEDVMSKELKSTHMDFWHQHV